MEQQVLIDALNNCAAIQNILNKIVVGADPLVSLVEGWQDVTGISVAIWTTVNPATGAAWTRGVSGAYLRATSAPNASEVARLASVQQWINASTIFTTNTILRRLILEFEMKITAGLANLTNTACVWGLTAGAADTRVTNNLAGFALIGAGNALQTVTDLAGVETVNTGFGENLANWNKFRIEVYKDKTLAQARVRFYLNEVLIATHTTNLPAVPAFLQFYQATGAGGAATVEIGVIRAWYEDIER